MKTFRHIFLGCSLCLGFTGMAQRIDTSTLETFSPTTVRETYEICRYVSLTPEQQVELAKSIEKENTEFMTMVSDNEGFLAAKDEKKLVRKREQALTKILTSEQLAQYYRGIYNAEALAEGNAVANKLRTKYGLTDQNWKFIRNAFYKIGLESRVLKETVPQKKAESEIALLRSQQLDEIEARGGIRVDPVAMTVTVVREFNPTALRKE